MLSELQLTDIYRVQHTQCSVPRIHSKSSNSVKNAKIAVQSAHMKETRERNSLSLQSQKKQRTIEEVNSKPAQINNPENELDEDYEKIKDKLIKLKKSAELANQKNKSHKKIKLKHGVCFLRNNSKVQDTLKEIEADNFEFRKMLEIRDALKATNIKLVSDKNRWENSIAQQKLIMQDRSSAFRNQMNEYKGLQSEITELSELQSSYAILKKERDDYLSKVNHVTNQKLELFKEVSQSVSQDPKHMTGDLDQMKLISKNLKSNYDELKLELVNLKKESMILHKGKLDSNSKCLNIIKATSNKLKK